MAQTCRGKNCSRCGELILLTLKKSREKEENLPSPPRRMAVYSSPQRENAAKERRSHLFLPRWARVRGAPHPHVRRDTQTKYRWGETEGEGWQDPLVVMQDARRGMKAAVRSPPLPPLRRSHPARHPRFPFLPASFLSPRSSHPDGKPAGALHFRVLQPAGAAKEMKTMRYSGHPLPYARRVS